VVVVVTRDAWTKQTARRYPGAITTWNYFSGEVKKIPPVHK